MSYIFRHRDKSIENVRSLCARGGKELYATVIKSGFNTKTVTVKVDFFRWISKYKLLQRRSSKFHIHDPYDMCRVGDKIYIKKCKKISPIKYYYVRNFFWMSPRINFVVGKMMPFEKEALIFNEKLQKNKLLSFKADV